MRQSLNFVKTTAALSGTVLMLGGTAVFTELSLLDYSGVKNKPTRITVGILSFSSISYVLVFSRGLSLWDSFSHAHQAASVNATESDEAPTEITFATWRINQFGYVIGVLAVTSNVIYFFFSCYLASRTLLESVSINEPIPQAIGLAYVWFSMVVVYLNFVLPRAINNAKDIAGLIFLRNRSDQSQAPRCKALAKTVMTTALGTLSFAGLVLFLVQNAIQSMPIARDFSDASKKAISMSVSISAAMMFALAKSLESYQYFSGQRHFNQAAIPIATRPVRAYCLLRSHQAVGACYLLVEFSAFYRGNLNLLQNFGADIELKTANIPFFAIAFLCSLSSAFIEYVFSYLNMRQTTEKQLLSWQFFNANSEVGMLEAGEVNEVCPEESAKEGRGISH